MTICLDKLRIFSSYSKISDIISIVSKIDTMRPN